jgi:hypothetical protein
MKASEILRGLADLIDRVETSSDEHGHEEGNTLSPIGSVASELEQHPMDSGDAPCPACELSPCGCEHGGAPDELDAIKQNAGLPIIVSTGF